MRRALLGELATRPGTPLSITTISESDQGLVFEGGPIIEDVKLQPRTLAVYLLVLWSVVVTAVTYIAALGGAVAGLRRRDSLAVFCVLAILLLLLGSSGYQAHARFRVPMIPYLALLATLSRWGGPLPLLARGPSLSPTTDGGPGPRPPASKMLPT